MKGVGMAIGDAIAHARFQQADRRPAGDRVTGLAGSLSNAASHVDGSSLSSTRQNGYICEPFPSPRRRSSFSTAARVGAMWASQWSLVACLPMVHRNHTKQYEPH